jgi:flagellar biosynthesis/type III secretory pathway M-ring protein FliF/YscJ
MDFLNSQLKYVGDQMRSLSASQKIAIVLLIVILLGGMYGLIHWGGQDEWIALLPQSFTPEQIQNIQSALAVAGEKTRVEGDRIMIRGNEDRRAQLTAMLAQNSALPKDISLGYASLVKASSVFMGDRSRVWMENRGLESELSTVLSRFRGVKDAHVFIEIPQQRGFGNRSTTSRASVHLTLADGEALDKQRIAAISNFVAGAVSGLDPRNVKITDGLRYYRPPDGASEMPTELLDIQRHAEEYHALKIADQLSYIPGVKVNVYATLRTTEEQIQEKTLGPAVVDSETSKTEETRSGGAGGDAGLRPNQGRALAEAGVNTSNSREESDTTLKGERDTKVRTASNTVGIVEELTATVNVPHSYLQHVLDAQKAAAPNAPASTIDKIAEVELPKIRALVKTLINAEADKQVAVDWFYDMPPSQQHNATTESQPAGTLAFVRDYGAQAGLGVLALLSVIFVLRMAGKAQGAIKSQVRSRGMRPAVVGLGPVGFDSPPEMLQKLGGGPVTVGEAEAMDAVMEGHEVDEKTVRTHQIVRQISQMVKEDPATAANIVQHWLKDEQ